MKELLCSNGISTVVDDWVYDWACWLSWFEAGGGYIVTTLSGTTVTLHRLIMNVPRGMVVDHINHNKKDNRTSNLRICTQGQNLLNMRKYRGQSGFKGIYWNKNTEKWRVQVRHEGKYLSIIPREYLNEAEAAMTYDKYIKQYHGEFAVLNFPEEGGKP